MNLALQKRNEQLERWRQNEANVELFEQQKQQLQSGINTNPSYNKKLNFSISPTSRRRGLDNESPDSGLKIRSTSNTKKSGTNKKACANGDINECERLLTDNLVNIDVTTSEGLTGLHQAAISGNVQMVEFLINHGANINCCDNEGWTPLHAASSLGLTSIVQLLLDYGADATIVNCENLLAYDLARNEEVQSLIGEHLQDLDIDYLRSQEERAIQKDIERWIKTCHYDERSHPVTGATALHVLAAKGYVNLLKQILESPTLKKQINLEAKDNEGFTPLLAASFWSQTDCVELLIEHGANIFAQASNGYKISSIYLQNYQQNKLQQQASQIETRASLDSKDTSKCSTTSLDSSTGTEPLYDDSDCIRSGSAPRHLRQGNLLKSQSLDIKQQTQLDTSTLLSGSMSVDRLLLRSESMTERELRKSYKDLVMENDRLKRHLKSIDDIDKQKQQDWIRKERQLERKISELEEENKQLEQWKQENQRLKEENSSLIRVLSKISKKH